MIYLATPYSNDDPAVRQHRYEVVTKVAAALMLKGKMVISPITHSHPLVVINGQSPSWEYWKDFDSQLMSLCDKLIVLKLPGWAISVGVKSEIELARSLDLAIKYMFPEDVLTIKGLQDGESD